MSTTVNIPLQTLNKGSKVLPTANIPVGATGVELHIDRTAGTNSINGNASLTMRFLVEESDDNGVTFNQIVACDLVGGLWPDGEGSSTDFLETVVGCGFLGDPSSTTREVRATLTSSARVSVQGSLIIFP